VLGTDRYASDLFKQHLYDLLVGEEEMNVALVDLKETPVEAAIAEAESFSFFGGQKLVVLENPYFLTGSPKPRGAVEQNPEALLAYLKNPSPTSCVLIMAPYEKLDTRKKVVKELKKAVEEIDAAPLKPNEVQQFVVNEFSGAGISIAQDALLELLARVDYNLLNAMNELNKLKSLGEAQITLELVADLVPRTLDQKVFDLTKYIMGRNAKGALDLYADLVVQGEDPIKLNAILIQHFSLMLQIKFLQQQRLSDKEMGSALGANPWQIGNIARDSRPFAPQLVSLIVGELIEMDFKFKSVNLDNKKQFEILILKHCNL
jgi:DNA polymerase-3 subunit delta